MVETDLAPEVANVGEGQETGISLEGTFEGLEPIMHLNVESSEPPRDENITVNASQVGQAINVGSGSSRPLVEPSGSGGATTEAGEGLDDDYDSDTGVLLDTEALLEDWDKHVAYRLWKKTQDRGLIQCKQYTTSLHLWKLEHESEEFMTRLKANPLYKIIDASYLQANRVIVCGFLERWHPETTTFHLPFGEMTITLDDVKCITGLPVTGKAMNCSFPKDFDYKQFVSDILGLELGVVALELEHCNGHRVSKSWLKKKLAGKCGRDGITVDQAVRGYLLYLLSCTLFQDRSGDKIPIVYLHFLMDLDKVNESAWGAATLANLYRQLSKATRMGAAGVSDYLTLLEVWVYEHFPTLEMPKNDKFVEGQMALSMRWKPITGINDTVALISLKHLREDLDLMNARDVVWDPYKSMRTLTDNDICWYYRCIRTLEIVEPYHPNRVVRQFGHIQSVPQPPIPPKKARRSGSPRKYSVKYASRDDDFKFYRNHLVNKDARLGKARFEWETTKDYMPWYCQVAVRRLIGVSKRKRQDPIQDEDGLNKIINAFEDVKRNRKKSKKELLQVIDMAHAILVQGSCRSNAPVGVEVEDEDEEREERWVKRPRTSKKAKKKK